MFYTTNDWNTNQDATYRPPAVPHTCTSSMADTTDLTAATKPSMDQSTWSFRSTSTKKAYLLVTAVYHAPVRKRQSKETVRGGHGGMSERKWVVSE
jgi:hypothetical protein